MAQHTYVNHLAVIACVVVAQLLGGLWYSKALFLKAWLAGSGLTAEKAQPGHPARVYGGAIVAALIGAYVFAYLLGRAPTVVHATIVGFSVGLGIVAGSFAVNYLFENKSMKLLAVNGGYHIVQFTLWGLILGAWQ
jgi:hypothetical protein